MKLIVAYIRPECLNAVKQELYSKKIYKFRHKKSPCERG